MRIALAAFVLLVLSTHSQAAFTDFSDYTQYEEFDLGEVFTSKDRSFKAVDFSHPSTPVPVRIFAGGDYASMIPGPGVELLISPNTQEVSLRYGGAGYKISVNGATAASGPIFQTLLDELDGTTLGEVSISATRSIPSPMGDGHLTLRGPINSFIIAGVELTIDDITVRVPEPTSTALVFLLLGAIPSRQLRLRRVK